LANSKNVVLLILAALSFVYGAVSQYLFPGRVQPPSDLAFVPLFALLIFIWYRLDTDQRAYRRTPLLNVGVVALAVFALPYYFFRSRGARGGFLALGLFTLCLVAAVLITVAGQYFAYYVLQS
jgi:hypothetical protein